MIISKERYDDINIIKEKALKYNYALIYMLSEVKLMDNWAQTYIDWDEILEARFFDRSGELHIFYYDDKISAVEIIDDTEHTILNEYALIDKFRNVGNGIIVRQNINYDEDGQAYVQLTRLVEIVRG